jgi:hypothetical protein
MSEKKSIRADYLLTGDNDLLEVPFSSLKDAGLEQELPHGFSDYLLRKKT